MRSIQLSLVLTTILASSCSHYSSQPKTNLVSYNPKSELGIKGNEIQAMVDSALKIGGRAPEFLATDLFIKANDASMRGDVQTAARIFKYAIELQPNDEFLKKKYAIELIRSGDLKEAEKSLEVIVKKSNFKDDSTALILAGVYSALEKPKEARATYQHLLSVNPESEEACLFLSKSYSAEKMYKEAHALLSGCQKRSSENPAFAFYRGRMDYERGMKVEAKKFFEESLKIDPTYAQGALAIGALFEEKEDFVSAMKVYKKFLSNDDNMTNVPVLTRIVAIMFSLEKNDEVLPYAEALSSIDNSDVNLKVRLALLYSDSNRFEEAINLLREVQEVVPDSDKVHYYLGALFQQTKKYNDALTSFKKITKASPLYGEAGMQIGQILGASAREDFVQGQTAAIAEFTSFINQKSVEQPEMLMEFKMLEASFYEDTTQFSHSIAVLKSLKDQKSFTESHSYYLASLMEKNGQYIDARQLVQAIIDKDPNNAHALNFMGYSYLERNEKMELAFDYISKAVSLRPDDGYIRDSLAWYYYQIGKFTEALKEAKKAVELVKGDPTITKHLGMIYQRLANVDKARVYLTESLQYTKVDAERKDLLKIIEDLEKSRLPASVP
jgi:tetratricopeptide (TPR) repeat protein